MHPHSGTQPETTDAKSQGAVVQLVRMPACHAGGRGFESLPHRRKSLKLSFNSLRDFFFSPKFCPIIPLLSRISGGSATNIAKDRNVLPIPKKRPEVHSGPFFRFRPKQDARRIWWVCFCAMVRKRRHYPVGKSGHKHGCC